MILEYDILKNPDDVDIRWKGTVRLSQSLADCMTEPAVQDDMKIYTLYDRKFSREDNAQLDNPAASKNFPNSITVILKGGRMTEFMKCSAFTKQECLGAKRLMRTAKQKKTTVKGFFLEPLSQARAEGHACLSVFQFDNGDSANQAAMRLDSVDLKHSLVVERLGCVAFTSGSQGSSITFSRDPKKSVTILYVASDQRPFVARLQTNRATKRIVCRSNGEAVEGSTTTTAGHAQDLMPGKPSRASSLDEALKILNVRLAKGEITIHEYKNLRKAMEGNEN